MLHALIGWVKSLFSGAGGAAQIGRANQSATVTTAGQNSPAVFAGRDVVYHVPPTRPRLDSLVELERLMPSLLSDLHGKLASYPLMRELIVVDRAGILYHWPNPHLKFSADEEPEIWQQIAILQGHGLVHELRERFAYRLSEEFVQRLKMNDKPGDRQG